MAADWDNCMILDGCRYDDFADRVHLPGTLEQRQSLASSTPEFLRANLDGRDLRDTVYVTANPTLRQIGEINTTFHAVVDVWNTDWDSDLCTVPPAPVTDRAIDAAKRYPNKRLIVHYLQPHYPFIGPTGRWVFDYTGY